MGRGTVFLVAMLAAAIGCKSAGDGSVAGDGSDAGQGGGPGTGTPAEQVPLGDLRVDVAADGVGWSLVRGDDRVLVTSASGVPGVVRTVEDSAEVLFGSFVFEEREVARREAAHVRLDAAEPDSWARLALEDAGGRSLSTLELSVAAPGTVRGSVSLTDRDAEGARATLRFACRPGDRFTGLGAQTDAFDHRGHHVPVWASEQGMGKKAGATPDDFPMGDLHDSYLPVPWVLDPGRGFGLLVEGTERAVLDLCAADPDAWAVEVRAARWSFLVFDGPEPLTVIERMTGLVGRQRPSAPWVLGVWTDAIRGREQVLEHVRALRAANVPVSAVWAEDWAGHRENPLSGFSLTYYWDADETLYPDLPSLAGELDALGVRFLGYFNSFMPQDSPHWDEAVAEGHLVQTEAGEPYVVTAATLRAAGLIDVTRSATRDWMAGHMRRAVDNGLRGWMADFAEWLPTDAVCHAGDGWLVHNAYPVLWASLNREVLEQAAPPGDWVFFSRSGHTGSWAWSPVVWGGDQNTDWDLLDGLPSALTLGVNLGATGVPFYGSDIGGYSTLPGQEVRDKELFLRWTELAAWTPVMRTHHGHDAARNWQLVETETTLSDAETLEHFGRLARLHQSLYPYLHALAARAVTTGWPLMRGVFLHHPDDPEAYRTDRFLLGEHVLVAPVLEQGAVSRTVHLPEGRWYPWEGGDPVDGPAAVEVDAPLGTVPVFLRAGAVVPAYATPPDTLVPDPPSGLTGRADADGHLVVHAAPGAAGSFTLADGTRLVLEPTEEGGAELKVEGGPTRQVELRLR